MSVVVTDLFVYPVKGLSGQPLRKVAREPGCGIPGDRAFALARPDGRYVAGQRQALPKDQFMMLAKDERLAGLRSRLDPCSSHATVSVRDLRCSPATSTHPKASRPSEQLFARVLDLPKERGPAAGS